MSNNNENNNEDIFSFDLESLSSQTPSTPDLSDDEPKNTTPSTDDSDVDIFKMDDIPKVEAPSEAITPEPVTPITSETPSFDDMDDLNIGSDSEFSTATWNSTPSDEDVAQALEEASLSGKSKKKKVKKAKKEKVKNDYPSLDKPRKKWPIVLASVLGSLAVVAGVLVYLLILNPVTSNKILSTVLSPKLYYGKTELSFIDDLKEDIDKNFDTNYAAVKKVSSNSIGSTFTVGLGKGVQSYASLIGEYANLLTAIKTVSIKTDSKIEGNKSSYVVDLLLNEQSIIGLNIILDKDTSAIFLQCPAVSKRWFKVTASAEELSSAETSLKLANGLEITGKDINTLIDTYLPLLVDYVNTVSLNKDISIQVENSKVTVNEAIVNLSKNELIEIEKTVLKKAKTDRIIFNIVNSLGIYTTQPDFTKAIDKVISNLSKSKQSGMKMHVYIDKEGKILGRKFIPAGDGHFNELTFLSYPTGNITKYSFKCTDDLYDFSLEGNNEVKNDKNTGSFKVKTTIKNTGSEASSETDSFEDLPTDEASSDSDGLSQATDTPLGLSIEYSDIYVTNKDKGTVTGTITIKPTDMPEKINGEVIVKLSEVSGFQQSEIAINMLKQNMLTLTSLASDSTQKEVTLPASAIDAAALSTDKLIQYNLLLELNFTKPTVALIKACNNPFITKLIAQYSATSGVKYLNGKQTAATLMVLGKSNPLIKAIFADGYIKTKKGLNPGLDAQEVATDGSATQKATDNNKPANNNATNGATTDNTTTGTTAPAGDTTAQSNVPTNNTTN